MTRVCLLLGMVDSICIFFCLCKRKYLCCCRLDGSKQRSTGALHLDGFESHHPKAKRKSTPNGVLFFLVGDGGFEPPKA